MSAIPLPAGSLRPRRALLVDDDKFMLVVLGDLLREMGVTGIVTAANGAAGIEAYDRSQPPPELVVCDLNMPGNDGFQFMEQLGARSFAGGIVLVSGMEPRTLKSAALMARFHRLNILATLAKPVDGPALRAALAGLA
jgi:CheY-like chemotaxis protein